VRDGLVKAVEGVLVRVILVRGGHFVSSGCPCTKLRAARASTIRPKPRHWGVANPQIETLAALHGAHFVDLPDATRWRLDDAYGVRTVHVQRDASGKWEVALPDRRTRVTCETLDDAKRIGYLWAARRHPCELIIRDAYYRVLSREFIGGAGGQASRRDRYRGAATSHRR